MGGLDINSQGDVNIGGDVVGRDKISVTFNFTVQAWGETPLRGHKLLQRNPAFVGRTATFNAIAEKLKEDNALVIVHGPGGMGKTQLAIEFGHLMQKDFPGGVFYLRCAQPDLIDGEVAACGDEGRLNLPGWEALPQPEQVSRVQAACLEAVPRLLIFDNCEDVAALNRWRPTTGGTRVLVTARKGEWPRTLTRHVLELPPLDRAASLQLLGHTDAAAHQIADALGDLPLALHLAGAYMAHYGQTPAQYLAELNAQALLSHESLNDWLKDELPTEHIANVAATFELSYGKLKGIRELEIGELARRVFGLLAYCAPAVPLPRDVLLRALQAEGDEEKAGKEGNAAGPTDKQLMDALHALVAVGLTSLNAEKQPSQHRLLQAFAELKLAEIDSAPSKLAGEATSPPLPAGEGTGVRASLETALAQIATKLNEAGLPAPMRPLVPHLETVAANAEANGSEKAGFLYNELGYHWNMVANYPAARAAFERALKIDEHHFGPDHPNIARYINNLGMLHKALGDLPTARTAYERALKILEIRLGAHHPSIASLVNNLGNVYRDLGDLPTARAAYERALKILEARLGAHHPSIASLVNNLGNIYQELGDLPAARAAHIRALTIDETHFGPNHPNVAIRVNNLGMVHKALGDLPAARAAYERALTIDETHFGPDHPSVATGINNLAGVYYALGDLPTACAAYARALRIMEKYTPNNPNTKLVRENLARVIKEMEA